MKNSRTTLDPYLLEIAKKYKSHSFLGGATHGCYIEMIKYLVDTYQKKGVPIGELKVLDWGSGKGHISYLLQKSGFVVHSCDVNSDTDDSSFGQSTPIISENSIDIIPLNHPWVLPFKHHEFDLVVGFGVLEHVEDDLESLKEIHRILKPGGIFFFSFLPYWLSWTQRVAHLMGNFYHSRLYSIRRLQQLAELANFKIKVVNHGQFFPKNSMPYSRLVEKADFFITRRTPFKYFATNLEGILIAE